MKKTLIAFCLLVVASGSVSAQGCELLGGLFKRRVRTSCNPVRVVRVQHVTRGCGSGCELPPQAMATPQSNPQTPKVETPSKSTVPPPAKKSVKTSMTEIGGCPYVTLLD